MALAKDSTDTHMVWMDMEMTGLDPQTDEIIEIATVITDGELNVIAELPSIILHQDQSRFAKMDDWNKEQHTKSGLWAEVVKSTVTLADAEQQTLAFIKKHIGPKKSPLCGNSIWQDRRFLRRYMQEIDAYLHYRIVDVSTIKELVHRWYPQQQPTNKNKANVHRAVQDVYDSIEELKLYRQQYFVHRDNVGQQK